MTNKIIEEIKNYLINNNITSTESIGKNGINVSICYNKSIVLLISGYITITLSPTWSTVPNFVPIVVLNVTYQGNDIMTFQTDLNDKISTNTTRNTQYINSISNLYLIDLINVDNINDITRFMFLDGYF